MLSSETIRDVGVCVLDQSYSDPNSADTLRCLATCRMLQVTESRVAGEEGWQVLLDDRRKGKEGDGKEFDRRGTGRTGWKEGVCFKGTVTQKSFINS